MEPGASEQDEGRLGTGLKARTSRERPCLARRGMGFGMRPEWGGGRRRKGRCWAPGHLAHSPFCVAHVVVIIVGKHTHTHTHKVENQGGAAVPGAGGGCSSASTHWAKNAEEDGGLFGASLRGPIARHERERETCARVVPRFGSRVDPPCAPPDPGLVGLLTDPFPHLCPPPPFPHPSPQSFSALNKRSNVKPWACRQEERERERANETSQRPQKRPPPHTHTGKDN